jgi:hypothetical protein
VSLRLAPLAIRQYGGFAIYEKNENPIPEKKSEPHSCDEHQNECGDIAPNIALSKPNRK